MSYHLPIEKKSLILSMLTEGQSIRAAARIADVSPVTVLKLLLDAAKIAREVHDSMMVNLQVRFIQADEQFGYIFCKQKNVRSPEEATERGDFYTFIAMDSETKLVPCYRVGKRTGYTTVTFLTELATRVTSRFQLSTDSFGPYRDAVDRIFGTEVDYGQIHKVYQEDKQAERRYSPGKIIRATKMRITGDPIQKRISTSHIERQNMTVRMNCRRFTRLTNAFSKSVPHHEAAVDLHYFAYNFMRIHQTLRVTPAMEAGVTKRLWTWADLLTWNRIAEAA